MKIRIGALLVFATINCHSQLLRYRWPAAPPPPTPLESTRGFLDRTRPYFQPVDPWRKIDGMTVYAKGQQWVQFVGRVVEAQPKGIRIKGWYGPPMTWPDENDSESGLSSYAIIRTNKQDAGLIIPLTKEFFVEEFPYYAAEDEFIGWEKKYVAMLANTYTYTTVIGGNGTVRQLTYSKITTPPQPRELTDEEKTALEQKRRTADEIALKEQKLLCEKGDAYGQFKMGMRYLKGDGVEQDRAKALDLLGKASLQGREDAQRALRDELKSQ